MDFLFIILIRSGEKNVCIRAIIMPVDHYENFPVASYWLPATVRPAVVAIYRLARYADDCADEGDVLPEERLRALDALDEAVDQAIRGDHVIADSRVAAMVPYMKAYGLSWSLWHDLFSAFKQDVTVHRYISHEHLLNYCARSANPIGRLLMPIYSLPSSHLECADALCTALQLINFWQDIAIDEAKQRRYLPDEDVIQAGLSLELPLCDYVHHSAWFPLIDLQLERAENLMCRAAPLLGVAKGRIRWELALTMAGGARIIEKIRDVKANVFAHRPKIGLADFPFLLYYARQWILRGERAL
jgi:squalene synthase HpnC